jgi:transposase InsO family protein
VSDITYLPTLAGWVYLTVALDLYDRNVIGWAFSADMESVHTTIPAMEMAFANRKAREGLIVHSDRGAQYCAKAFRETPGERCPSVRQSMSRKGNCRDNACAESFFKTVKRELETLDGGHTAEEVRQSVFMYVEAYYNRIRMHSALDYMAPVGRHPRPPAPIPRPRYFLSFEPVPKLIDCALTRTVLEQALAVFQAKALQNCVF